MVITSVSIEPQLAYPDSFFRAQARWSPGAQGASYRCHWMSGARALGAQIGQPDGDGDIHCELDGLDTDLAAGDEIHVAVYERSGGVDSAPAVSTSVTVQDHPTMMVTEMAGGHLAYLDTQTGTITGRIDLTLSEAEVGEMSLSGASTLYGYPMKVGYEPDGGNINVSSSTYGVIWEIDPLAREALGWHQVSTQIYWYLYSEDGQTIYVTDMQNNGVSVLDRQTWEVVQTLQTGSYPIALTRDPQGGLWVPHHHDRWTSVVQEGSEGLELVDKLDGGGPYFATLHPDKESMWVACEHEDLVQVYSLPDRELVSNVAVGDLPNYVFFTDGGARAWVTNFDGQSVSVIDTDTMQSVNEIETGAGALSVKMRDDGRFVYVSNLIAQTVTVIDLVDETVADEYQELRGPRWIEWLRE